MTSFRIVAGAVCLALMLSLGLALAAAPDCTTQLCVYVPVAFKPPSGAPEPTQTEAPLPTTTASPTTTPAGPSATPTQTRTPSPSPTRTTTPSPSPSPTRTATPSPTTTQTATPTRNPAQCAAEYPTVCIPPPPPDLNCADITYRNFVVLPPDRHGFDGNQNGIGCEQ